mmetsp:Transcript_3908/g.14760  ORF Transcript_3908/g.14760 Transcript_3908/m.14760 type:complete len:243 (+) Transcript_3908:5176-5904(+)
MCLCDSNFGGADCERDCLNPNPDWEGTSCDIPRCFGIPQYDPKVCTSHGICIAPNTCECLTDYSGSDCASFQCYNISTNDTNVCSGHGRCELPDNCVCMDGYSHNFSAPRKDCHHVTCEGILSGTAGECHGRGMCVGPNQCAFCVPPFFGADCDEADRFVSPEGDDTSNNCLVRSFPCRTIFHAMKQATNRNQIVLLEGSHYISEIIFVKKSFTILGENRDKVKIVFDSLSTRFRQVMQVFI